MGEVYIRDHDGVHGVRFRGQQVDEAWLRGLLNAMQQRSNGLPGARGEGLAQLGAFAMEPQGTANLDDRGWGFVDVAFVDVAHEEQNDIPWVGSAQERHGGRHDPRRDYRFVLRPDAWMVEAAEWREGGTWQREDGYELQARRVRGRDADGRVIVPDRTRCMTLPDGAALPASMIPAWVDLGNGTYIETSHGGTMEEMHAMMAWARLTMRRDRESLVHGYRSRIQNVLSRFIGAMGDYCGHDALRLRSAGDRMPVGAELYSVRELSRAALRFDVYRLDEVDSLQSHWKQINRSLNTMLARADALEQVCERIPHMEAHSEECMLNDYGCVMSPVTWREGTDETGGLVVRGRRWVNLSGPEPMVTWPDPNMRKVMTPPSPTRVEHAFSELDRSLVGVGTLKAFVLDASEWALKSRELWRNESVYYEAAEDGPRNAPRGNPGVRYASDWYAADLVDTDRDHKLERGLRLVDEDWPDDPGDDGTRA